MDIFNNQKILITLTAGKTILDQASMTAFDLQVRNASLYVNNREVLSVRFWSNDCSHYPKRLVVDFMNHDGIVIFCDKEKTAFNPPSDFGFKTKFRELIHKEIKLLPTKHFKGEDIELTIDLSALAEELLKLYNKETPKLSSEQEEIAA